jgi:hypothetical protein
MEDQVPMLNLDSALRLVKKVKKLNGENRLDSIQLSSQKYLTLQRFFQKLRMVTFLMTINSSAVLMTKPEVKLLYGKRITNTKLMILHWHQQVQRKMYTLIFRDL